MNIPYIKVIQVITILKYNDFSYLKDVIKSRLRELFDQISLKICQIKYESIIKKQINLVKYISDIFTKDSKAEYFHITIYFQLK